MNNKTEISKKKNNKQGHPEATMFKKKKEIFVIYFWPLPSQKVS